MNLSSHISALLFEHDCVIIPGFGGLVGNEIPASLDKSRDLFMPPYKKLTFNSNLKNNDGLLANRLTTEEELSYNDAVKCIGDFVKSIEQSMVTDSEFFMQDIGRFALGKESKVHFEQDLKVNYLPRAYGQSAFSAIPIQRDSLERKVEKKLKEKIPSVRKQVAEGKVLRKRSNKPVWITAAVVLFAALLFFSSQNKFIVGLANAGFDLITNTPEPKYGETFVTKLPDADEEITGLKQMLAMQPDTTRYLNIVIGGSVPIVVRLKEEVKTSKSVQTGMVSMPYHIVGGAFAVPENAAKFKEQLTRSGYPSVIVGKKSSNLQCVSYGGFATREEALRALDKIRAVQNDAWIMTL